MTVLGEWGARAARVYDQTRADQYRRHDDHLTSSQPSMEFARWLSGVCDACGRDLTVLDLGCGTGRYFYTLKGVRELVGLDASATMLEHARRPWAADRIQIDRITLVEGDIFNATFEPARFDLIYSIGVLAELSPLNEAVVSRVTAWLKPGGRFAFSTVRPDSPSMHPTIGRRLGLWWARHAPYALSGAVRRRLLSGGLYADEDAIRNLLMPAFDIESLCDFQSEAPLHCLCVARKKMASNPNARLHTFCPPQSS